MPKQLPMIMRPMPEGRHTFPQKHLSHSIDHQIPTRERYHNRATPECTRVIEALDDWARFVTGPGCCSLDWLHTLRGGLAGLSGCNHLLFRHFYKSVVGDCKTNCVCAGTSVQFAAVSSSPDKCRSQCPNQSAKATLPQIAAAYRLAKMICRESSVDVGANDRDRPAPAIH